MDLGPLDLLDLSVDLGLQLGVLGHISQELQLIQADVVGVGIVVLLPREGVFEGQLDVDEQEEGEGDEPGGDEGEVVACSAEEETEGAW